MSDTPNSVQSFLDDMELEVPWKTLVTLVEPHWETTSSANAIAPLEALVRIFYLQRWLHLEDEQVTVLLRDNWTCREFVGINTLTMNFPDVELISRFGKLFTRLDVALSVLPTLEQRAPLVR